MYTELIDNLHPLMLTMYTGGNDLNTTPHDAWGTQNWLQLHPTNFQVVHWLLYFPDFKLHWTYLGCVLDFLDFMYSAEGHVFCLIIFVDACYVYVLQFYTLSTLVEPFIFCLLYVFPLMLYILHHFLLLFTIFLSLDRERSVTYFFFVSVPLKFFCCHKYFL